MCVQCTLGYSEENQVLFWGGVSQEMITEEEKSELHLEG